jgi:hypothetical protein
MKTWSVVFASLTLVAALGVAVPSGILNTGGQPARSWELKEIVASNMPVGASST